MNTQLNNSQPEGRKEKLVQRFIIASVATVLLVIVVLVLPIQIEHRVYVTVGFDKIDDVSTETIRVPLISTFFRSNQQRTGVYTIKMQVEFSNHNYTIENVPSGEYVFLVSNVTAGLSYIIAVQLVKNSLIIGTFTLHTTF